MSTIHDTPNPMDLFQSNTVQQFWNRMSSLCEVDRPPQYADLDLMSLHQLAPNMVLLDVVVSPDRLRVRYAGTAVIDMLGREITGMCIRHVDTGPFRDRIITKYARAVSDGRPQWSMADVAVRVDRSRHKPGLRTAERRFRCERLAFPLHDGTGTISHVAAILVRHKPVSTGETFEWHQMHLPKPQ